MLGWVPSREVKCRHFKTKHKISASDSGAAKHVLHPAIFLSGGLGKSGAGAHDAGSVVGVPGGWPGRKSVEVPIPGHIPGSTPRAKRKPDNYKSQLSEEQNLKYE